MCYNDTWVYLSLGKSVGVIGELADVVDQTLYVGKGLALVVNLIRRGAGCQRVRQIAASCHILGTHFAQQTSLNPTTPKHRCG